MRIVILSDTHELHRHYGREPWGDVPAGDLLVHCGDITTHGIDQEVENFLRWFERQPHPYKVWIAGNHDRSLDGVDVATRWAVPGIIYLENKATEIPGLTIWGSPYTPDHQDFAFQLRDRARSMWASIPANVDLLVTHGPPYGIMDTGHGEEHAGCPTLLEEIQQRVKPKIHAFGHIHEGYGQQRIAETLFINASVHTWLWKQEPRQDPHVIQQ